MSKPEVSRRNEDGDRIAVIHSYAAGDGNLSFVAANVEHSHSAIFPGPTREECEAACPYGWELYQEGSSWRARKFISSSTAEEAGHRLLDLAGTAPNIEDARRLRVDEQ
jgi:hypothetical protein